jgi:hypothetical protein
MDTTIQELLHQGARKPATRACALEQIAWLATDLSERLQVTSEKCECCGQHTQPAKAAYIASQQLNAIIRQAEKLQTMESAGLLPWEEE